MLQTQEVVQSEEVARCEEVGDVQTDLHCRRDADYGTDSDCALEVVGEPNLSGPSFAASPMECRRRYPEADLQEAA